MSPPRQRPVGASKSPKGRRLLASTSIDLYYLPLLCVAQAVLFLLVWIYLDRVPTVPFLLPLSPSSQSPPPVSHPLQDEVDSLVAAHRETVQSFVQQQSMSWQRHYTSLEKDERAPAQVEAARHALSTLPHHTDYRLEEDRRPSDDPVAEDAPLQWDAEEDIPLYLELLLTNCGQKATSVEVFQRDCWDVLYDLVERPRCTVRLDSRYHCAGEAAKEPVTTPADLLRTHLREDSLNVVILGAGPVGLHLANALASLSLSNAAAAAASGPSPPSIHIVVFENRRVADGHKKPYVRNWITDVREQFFVGVDRTLHAILLAVHYPEYVRLPIETLETLFLVSCRHLGVKFLYDDYTKFADLMDALPNLVVFDATGHRLGAMERGTDVTSTTSLPSVQPWSWDPMVTEKTYFSRQQYEDLIESESLVHIAEQETKGGPIMYPVSPNGMPYQAHFLKLNNVQIPLKDWRIVQHLRNKWRSDVSPYCRTSKPCQGQPFTCRQWCSRLFAWDASQYFRPDILKRINIQLPRKLALTLALVSLTGQQADALWSLLDKPTNGQQESHLLLDLPLSALAQSPLFESNGLDQVFHFLAKVPEAGSTVVNLFVYQPYMYKDPVVPGGFLGNNRSPLLRIGDSLASGDPNLSTGLGFHIHVVQDLVERLTLRLPRMVDDSL
jgi:hypothetical protein